MSARPEGKGSCGREAWSKRCARSRPSSLTKVLSLPSRDGKRNHAGRPVGFLVIWAPRRVPNVYYPDGVSYHSVENLVAITENSATRTPGL